MLNSTQVEVKIELSLAKIYKTGYTKIVANIGKIRNIVNKLRKEYRKNKVFRENKEYREINKY